MKEKQNKEFKGLNKSEKINKMGIRCWKKTNSSIRRNYWMKKEIKINSKMLVIWWQHTNKLRQENDQKKIGSFIMLKRLSIFSEGKNLTILYYWNKQSMIEIGKMNFQLLLLPFQRNHFWIIFLINLQLWWFIALTPINLEMN